MATINIAVTGCGHGELDAYYRLCDVFEKQGRKIDLLIITGDFQAMRNQEDLGSMKCPVKYKHMMNFHKYYSGKKVAPVLTIYIGGNHEASNYHKELHYGGWVAPNIYFMGHSNIIQYKGLRIGGLSGIYKSGDYDRGYYEKIPFDLSTREGMDAIASAYHYRRLEIHKLLSYPSPIDIMISHDWPSEMYNYGDVDTLLRKKPFFKEEIDSGCLGSTPLMSVLHTLQPHYWFASHLHVKYAAVFPHQSTSETTHFLALDKCVRGREFMQVVSVSIPESAENDSNLYYDPAWLAIVIESHHKLSTAFTAPSIPDRFAPSSETIERVEKMKQEGKLKIEANFTAIAPCYEGTDADGYDGSLAVARGNNQTDAYLQMLQLEHTVTIPYNTKPTDPNELDLDDLL